ncbi:MAG: 5,10-methylenetetrahydromethanopterin reductase, partial [Thermofilum sp. ex4484_82]
SPEPVLEKHGISVEDAMAIKKALEAGNWGEAFSKVTSEMIDAFSISGTPETCIERINELIKLGVTQFVVGSPIGPNVREAIDLISREIIPHFKE